MWLGTVGSREQGPRVCIFPTLQVGGGEMSTGQGWIQVSGESAEVLGREKPSLGDLGVAVYDKGLPCGYPCLSKLLYLLLHVKAYIFLRVHLGLNIFHEKGCPGKGAHWLNTGCLPGHLISMETTKFLCYCRSPLSEVPWVSAPDQVVWQGPRLTPTILNSGVSQSLDWFILTSSSCQVAPPLTSDTPLKHITLTQRLLKIYL